MEQNQQLTFGQRAVGLTFNPSNNAEVDLCKTLFAGVIDQMHRLREGSSDAEVKRMASVAITEAQTAQMWAVKAITWKPQEIRPAGRVLTEADAAADLAGKPRPYRVEDIVHQEFSSRDHWLWVWMHDGRKVGVSCHPLTAEATALEAAVRRANEEVGAA